MNILVVNDDGIKAKGIHILASKLLKYGNVYVVSPDRGRSAASHSVILNKPLKFEKVNEIENVICYQTSGMPADCVRLANIILGIKFDIVFSGVNDGLNLGTDVIYSGTVAGAREGIIEGIPGVAISTDFGCFEIVEKELDSLLDFVINNKLYSNECVLNINFPTSKFNESKGIKFARQGDKIFTSIFTEIDNNLYDVLNEEEIHDKNPDTDVYLADNGFITLLPLQVCQTNFEHLNRLKKLTLNK